LKKTGERNAQLLRLLRIIRDLDRLSGVDLYELAERHGASVRTIRRDLDALQAAGLPLAEEPAAGDKRKAWRIAYGDRLRRLADLLDASHYLALRAAMRGGGTPGRSSSLFAALEDLCDKIERALGPRERTRLQAIERAFVSHERFAYRRAPPEVFWPLIEAIAARRICLVTYRPPSPEPEPAALSRATAAAAVTRFRILPLRMFVHDSAVYLHAHVPRYGDVVTLNLQRLETLKLTNDAGAVPSGYDPTKWEAGMFGVHTGGRPTDYRLRFAAWAAPYIRERVWHPTQKLRELAGGEVELRFSCGESYEVTAWVASWRDAVEALAPASLRRELAALGRQWIRLYAKGNRARIDTARK
jgi:predicted DNA-binding transcriptional regulator YafY